MANGGFMQLALVSEFLTLLGEITTELRCKDLCRGGPVFFGQVFQEMI
jgi:hypothetical protein